jgi:hypothetical protein
VLGEPAAGPLDGGDVDAQVVGDLLIGVPLMGAEEDVTSVLPLTRQALAAELLQRFALLGRQPDRERLGTSHGHLLGKRWQDRRNRNK